MADEIGEVGGDVNEGGAEGWMRLGKLVGM